MRNYVSGEQDDLAERRTMPFVESTRLLHVLLCRIDYCAILALSNS
jgi:hypothetical protein